MKLWQIHQNILNLKRFQEIVATLAKYGFTDFLDLIGIDHLALGLAKRIGLVKIDYSLLSRPRRLKLALQELGPTFIKLGQILAGREDILPENYRRDLETLQEQAAPMSEAEVEQALRNAYSETDFRHHFRELNMTPLASGSIAQVHVARLQDGSRVILKIQKPNIEEIIRTDLEILSHLAGMIQQQLGLRGIADWPQFIDDFVRNIMRELDFEREARIMLRFAGIFAKKTLPVKIPDVYQQFSNKKVLVQEFVAGYKIQELPEIEHLSAKTTGQTILDSYCLMIFEEGLFHADPHAGNLRVLKSGELVFFDFGMVGQIDPFTRTQIARIFYGVAAGDYALVARSISLICKSTILGVSPNMIQEVKELADAYKNLPLTQIKASDFLGNLETVLRNQDLLLPAHLALLFKSMVTLEQSLKSLTPDLNLLVHIRPHIEKLIAFETSPSRLKDKFKENSFLALDYLQELHGDLFHLLKSLVRNQEDGQIRQKHLFAWFYRMEKLMYRAILGLLTASALIGSSILLATIQDKHSLAYFLGLGGYFLAGIFVLALVYNILTIQKSKE